MAKKKSRLKNHWKTVMESSGQVAKNIDAAEYKHVVLGLIF